MLDFCLGFVSEIISGIPADEVAINAVMQALADMDVNGLPPGGGLHAK